MLLLIYKIAIGGYDIGIRIASLFNEKARLFVTGRKDWRLKLLDKIPAEDSTPSVWFHCASLGEFEQGRPVIERIREAFPNHRLVLTFFSPSGYEVRKGFAGADVVCYLPIDNPKNAHDFVSMIKPAAAFFVKYEYWYFYLHELKTLGIPTYMVSAIFRDTHVFFKWYGGLQRKMLKCVTRFFVQDDRSMQLLASIGFSNVTLAGDTRYDRVVANASFSDDTNVFEKWIIGSVVLVAGSTWPKDEELLVRYLKEHQDLKLILVPHEIHEAHLSGIFKLLGTDFVRYTQANEQNILSSNCLVVDTIGLLSSIYRYANIAYIGGGFGVGIHNTLEAAVYGVPVVFGPTYQKFREARELIAAGGAFSIDGYESLQLILDQLFEDEKAGKSAGEYVQKNIGATEMILKCLF